MKQLPIFFNPAGRQCLVIGSNHAAWCKTQMLLSTGAQVHINAPSLHSKMKDHLRQGRLSFSEKKICDIEDSGFALVFIAECDIDRATALSQQCQRLGIPVNVVDQPALCSFTIPSIIDRSPITIAIGSAGSSPILARRLRSQIESLIPKAIGSVAQLMGRYRDLVAKHIPPSERRAFWERTLDGPITQQVLAGECQAAEHALEHSIKSRAVINQVQQRHVTIIDARHNNSELMTLQSVQSLHRAEHIVHAPSIDSEILRLARRDAHLHAQQRLDQDFPHAIQKLSEQLEALTQGGVEAVLLISNPNWPSHLIAAIKQNLQNNGIGTQALLSVEYEHAALREVS